jgi:hypothetical protein
MKNENKIIRTEKDDFFLKIGMGIIIILLLSLLAILYIILLNGTIKIQ